MTPRTTTFALTIVLSACQLTGTPDPRLDSSPQGDADTGADTAADRTSPTVGDTLGYEVLEAHEVPDSEGQTGEATPPPTGKCGGATPAFAAFTYLGRLTNTSTGTTAASCYYKVAVPADGNQCFIRYSIAYTPVGYSANNLSSRTADSYYRADGGIMYYSSGGYSYLRMDYTWCFPGEAEDGFKL